MTDNITDVEENVDEEHTEEVVEDHGDTNEATEPDTFPRSYVEQLRQENGKYRQRAQRADELAQRLHRALVEKSGRLQDPTDLPFDETHLEGDNLTAAIDELLAKKPHLAARRVAGDVGQGASVGKGDVSLLGLLGGR